MPVDKSLIKDKFNFIKPYLPVLRKIKNTEVNELLNSIELQIQSERIFEIISQIVLDICTHIAAHMEYRPTNSYSECILRLEENGILTRDFSKTIIQMIKMRNLIVHQYAQINHYLIYNVFQKLEEDFSEYQDQILSWLNQQDSK